MKMAKAKKPDWAAWIDKMPIQPTPGGTLHLTGKVDTNSTDLAFLQKRVPQGINPAVLQLELRVVTGIVPVENPQWVHYTENLSSRKTYTQVEVFYGSKRIANIKPIPVVV
jgi:hypothetical protein